MDASPISGFITRKHASENCKRSERTLQRYWSTAIEQKDATILPHLKLRTEDGEVVEGPNVTKELIDDLKKRRKNPTWYVHASWVQKTYGPRLDQDAPPPDKPTRLPADLSSAAIAPEHTHVTLLEQRISDLERDKDHLQAELKIKNEQIHQANERSRESHVLMRDLHELLRDMQRQLPALAPPPAVVTIANHSDLVTDDTVMGQGSKSNLPTTHGPLRTTTHARKLTQARTTLPKQKRVASQPRGVFAKHTPTFHKALSRLLHRP